MLSLYIYLQKRRENFIAFNEDISYIHPRLLYT